MNSEIQIATFRLQRIRKAVWEFADHLIGKTYSRAYNAAQDRICFSAAVRGRRYIGGVIDCGIELNLVAPLIRKPQVQVSDRIDIVIIEQVTTTHAGSQNASGGH